MSERDGWNHLYLIDAKTGAVKNQVTKGEWLVRGVDRVDEEARTVEFRAMGIHPGQDPYHVHLARVKFDGTGLTTLTDGDGTHTAQYSPGRKYLIDTYSRVDLPPVHELRRVEDGKLVLRAGKGRRLGPGILGLEAARAVRRPRVATARPIFTASSRGRRSSTRRRSTR